MSAAHVDSTAPFQVCKPLADREYANLKQSIQTYGCLVPVEVDEDGAVIDGHHRQAACEELGLSYERVLVAGLTQEQKVARAIEVNNVRRAPEWVTREDRDARIIELRREGKSTTVIAEEIGVSDETVRSTSKKLEVEDAPSEVVGRDGKVRPATHPDRSAEAVARRREVIAGMRESGATVSEIAEALGISTSAVYQTLRKLGTPASSDPEPQPAKPPGSVAEKYDRVRALADEGWTSAQIADAVGMSVEGLRNACRERGIEVPADAVVGKARHHDSNRIVGETVHALEAAVMGLRLVRIDDLDRTQIEGWTTSLTDSIRALNQMNKQMKEMVQ